jgi:hypothetical protein
LYSLLSLEERGYWSRILDQDPLFGKMELQRFRKLGTENDGYGQARLRDGYGSMTAHRSLGSVPPPRRDDLDALRHQRLALRTQLEQLEARIESAERKDT